jgi:GTP1/Obg family GTP-binding protein
MSGDQGSVASIEASRSIIRNASLSVERDAPEDGPAQIVALAKSHGGYAELVTRESVTVRIPAERLDTFLAAVPALGKVKEQNISAMDVTESHRDLKIRLAHLETMRTRYQALLEKAANVSEAVLVEKELERVTMEYESLKARLQSLEGQIALATVSLDFNKPIRPGPLGWVFYGLAKGVKWLFIWE